MWNKKILTVLSVIFISALFISTLIIGGFAVSEQEPMNLWFVAQQPGTSFYSYAIVMSRLMSEEFPPNSKIEVIPRGGSVSNPTIVNEGGADIGLTQAYTATLASRGEIMYEEKGPHENIRAVTGALDVAYVWVLARKSYIERTGFKTLEDIFTAEDVPRVGMKPVGSVVLPIADTILSTVGTSLDGLRDANRLYNAQPSQIGEMLRDGRLDVYFESTPLNHPGLTEVTLTNDMVFIPLNQEAQDLLLRDGMTMKIAPAGSYKGMDEDYNTPGTGNCIIASKDAEDDMIYLLTKTLVERKEELVEENAALSAWNPEEYLTTIPLHPGAKRYYDERGW
jgi:hypothetical protein